MEKEELDYSINLLDKMKWPSNKLGYLISNDEDLPPFRILSKILRQLGIEQQITWSKEDCIDAIGGIEKVNRYIEEHHLIETNLSDNFRAVAERELMIQQNLSEQIHDLIQGSSEEFQRILQKEEAFHIEQQQQMFI